MEALYEGKVLSGRDEVLLRLKGKVWMRRVPLGVWLRKKGSELKGAAEGEGKVGVAEGEGHWYGCLGVREKARGSA
ncbi:hypothetical protein OIU76_023236, partial [Salix suchowensis]